MGLLKIISREFHQTIVMITHNEAIAQLADRVIHLEDGRIVGDDGVTHPGNDGQGQAAAMQKDGQGQTADTRKDTCGREVSL